MTNEEFILVLTKKQIGSFVNQDFSQLDFSVVQRSQEYQEFYKDYMDQSRINFIGLNFSGSNFTSTRHISLESTQENRLFTDLTNANLTAANFENVDLS